MMHFYLWGLERCPCGKPATQQVMGSGNVPYGKYCDPCAKRRLKELDKAHNRPAEATNA